MTQINKMAWMTFLSLLLALPVSAATRGLDLIEIETSDGEAVELYQQSHALLIGVSDYQAGWPDLPGVKQDVQAVETALAEQGFNVVTVMDPTRDELDAAFTDFINQYGQAPDSRLLFYFSGHGHTLTLAYGDEMGYIVPIDAPNPHEDEVGFIANALDMQMIEVYAKRVQAKHALFLFDSCFSGTIFSMTRAVPESISYKTAKPVRQFLTSGSADEQVPDESVFRRQFIAALQGEGDLNSDGYVSGSELGEFLQDSVVNYSKGSQHPQYGKIRHANLDKGDFIFVLPSATVNVVESDASEAATTAAPAAQTVAPEVEMWTLVKDSEDASDVQDFLDAFPDGQFAKVAELKLKQLQRAAAEEPQQVEQSTRANMLPRQQPAEQSPAPSPFPEDSQAEQGFEGRPGPPPQEPGLISFETMQALTQIRDSLFMLKHELERAAGSRNSQHFDRTSRELGEPILQEVDLLVAALEEFDEYDPVVDALEAIEEQLPEALEELAELARKNRWLVLRMKIGKPFDELAHLLERSVEQATPPAQMPPPPPEQQGNQFPPELANTLQQGGRQLLALKTILQDVFEQQDSARFYDEAVPAADAVLETLDALMRREQELARYPKLEQGVRDLHHRLPRFMEILEQLVKAQKWQEMRQETRDKFQGFQDWLRSNSPEPPRPPQH